MKKLLVGLSAIFICTFAIAHSVEWYVDGSLYQTTTCDAGDNITPPTAPAKYGYHFDKWSYYAMLEYIELSGTQWIDTGFIANGGMILDAKVLPVNQQMLLGSIGPYDVNPDTTRNLITYNSNGVYTPQKLNKYTDAYAVAGTSPAVIHFDTTGTKFYCTVNGTVVINTTTDTLTNQTTTVKMSFSDYTSTTRSGRYYYVKITAADGNVVRNFIPAKRTSDNAVGMYDTVSQTFFTNAGTGEFIAGPEVGGI